MDDVCKFQKLPKRNVLGFDFDFVDIVHKRKRGLSSKYSLLLRSKKKKAFFAFSRRIFFL